MGDRDAGLVQEGTLRERPDCFMPSLGGHPRLCGGWMVYMTTPVILREPKDLGARIGAPRPRRAVRLASSNATPRWFISRCAVSAEWLAHHDRLAMCCRPDCSRRVSQRHGGADGPLLICEAHFTNQKFAFTNRQSSSHSGEENGRRTSNRLPSPIALVTEIVPSCASRIAFVMANPSP